MIRLYENMTIRKCGVFALLFIALILNGVSAFSSDYNYNETVFVHFDKDVYVAGGALHYKAYVVNGNRECQNNILYFSLYGINSRKELHWRTNVVNNMAYGLYPLPADLPEGIYEVRAYTNAMRCRSSEKSFRWRILIIGFTKQTTDTLFAPIVKPVRPVVAELTQSGIEMRVSGERINPGEIVNIGISNNTEDSAFMSLSVCLETPFSERLQNQYTSDLNEETTDVDIQNSRDSFSEANGYILSGTLLQRSTSLPLAHTKIILGVVDSTMPAILYSKTDEKGDFYFYLKPQYDNHDIVIQTVDDMYNGDLLWTLEDKALNSHPDMVLFKPEEEQQQFLNRLRELRVIEAVFNNQTDTLITEKNNVSYSDLFQTPSQIIQIWDYVSMQNFNEIDDNILPSIRFFSQNSRQSLMIYDGALQSWCDNILLLLNGVPFTDLDYFGLLSSKQLKRVELFNSGFVLGGLNFNGVVAAYTYDHAIPETYLQSKACVWQNKVISNGYKTIIPEQDGDDRIPDFRDNLCFEPDLRIGPGKTIHVSFPASCLDGKYHITLTGISDSGRSINLSSRFVIVPDNE